MERIPTPRMSEFLLQEFMIPMDLTARAVSEGAKIPMNRIGNAIRLPKTARKPLALAMEMNGLI